MSALVRYLASGHTRVEGWLQPAALAVIPQLMKAQTASGVTGPVCEIGVHHGRLLILLHLLTTDEERAIGWDLFSQQEYNVDRSGKGDLHRFTENIRRHGCDEGRLRAIEGNSLALTAERVISVCKGCPRVFSVDGGHTVQCVMNDLRLARDTIAEGGLVILDDCFADDWPGVSEGLHRLIAAGEWPLVPVVFGGNKTIFTTSHEWAGRYRSALDLPSGLYGQRPTQFYGHELITVTAWPMTVKRRLLHSRALRALRYSLLGRLLRPLA